MTSHECVYRTHWQLGRETSCACGEKKNEDFTTLSIKVVDVLLQDVESRGYRSIGHQETGALHYK